MPRVVLVRPAAAPPSVSEALVRMRGELLAAGFDAEVMDLPLGADVRASLERLAPPAAAGKSTTALVAVVPSADPGTAELWVIDRVTGKTVVRRVSAPPAADPTRVAEILAVRAVELLRASFLELAIAPPAAETGGTTEAAAPAPAAPVVERWATAPLEERDWTWAIEAGGGTAKALRGPWNQFLPVARLERAFGQPVVRAAGVRRTGHRRPRARGQRVGRRITDGDAGRDGGPVPPRPMAGAADLRSVAEHCGWPKRRT